VPLLFVLFEDFWSAPVYMVASFQWTPILKSLYEKIHCTYTWYYVRFTSSVTVPAQRNWINLQPSIYCWWQLARLNMWC